MDIRKKVGERIKHLRKLRGLSQEKLALLCEIDRTYIASVENCKRNISIINIERICISLEITLEKFFEGI